MELILIALRHFFTIGIIVLGVATIHAQELTPWVIGSAGSSSTVTAYRLDWTLGETAMLAFTQGGNVISQGFQQPFGYFEVYTKDVHKDYIITVFPNPTMDRVTIATGETDQRLLVEVMDLYGRVRLRQDIESPTSDLYLGSFPSATYLLRVTDRDHIQIGVWRVQKMW
jgi:hypothetical protein